ncbi:hypothetical protein RW64_20770 [Geobacter sulfurreducens]|nr:hypothetical protein RW64_20770 [Geobacter sulfurreducens]
MKTRIALIQNNLSPYRIPLFEKIGQTANVDFTLYLMAPDKPSYPTWKFDFDTLPFRAVVVPGWRIVKRNLVQICINPALLTHLLRERPQAVICCGFSISTLFVTLYHLLTGASMVVWMEATLVTEGAQGLKGLRGLVRRLLARQVAGFVDAGRLSRDYIRSLLPETSDKPIRTSYNCVDTGLLQRDCERFRNSGDEWGRFRSRFPERVILFSGQLIERKGVREMIEVYQRVTARAKERVGLILLGDGNLRPEIERLKTEKGLEDLFIEGFIEPRDYPKYFAVADLFLLLSLSDPNPLVVFEAQSCGLPLICSDRAGNAPDFVRDGVNGYVVDPTDIEGVTGKVLAVLGNPGISEMGKESRAMVQKANYGDSAKAFVDIVQDVLEARGSGAGISSASRL